MRSLTIVSERMGVALHRSKRNMLSPLGLKVSKERVDLEYAGIMAAVTQIVCVIMVFGDLIKGREIGLP
jgi:hypothetical protein